MTVFELDGATRCKNVNKVVKSLLITFTTEMISKRVICVKYTGVFAQLRVIKPLWSSVYIKNRHRSNIIVTRPDFNSLQYNKVVNQTLVTKG